MRWRPGLHPGAPGPLTALFRPLSWISGEGTVNGSAGKGKGGRGEGKGREKEREGEGREGNEEVKGRDGSEGR